VESNTAGKDIVRCVVESAETWLALEGSKMGKPDSGYLQRNLTGIGTESNYPYGVDIYSPAPRQSEPG
jgi:hypothetical protein